MARNVLHVLRNRWHQLAAGALALDLALQNTADTRLDFLWLEFISPMWFVMLVATAAGFVLAITRRRRRRGGAHR
ncbi:MAG: hypothetical protein NTX33_07520 [Propionibacteriales bacterium]|nr:hypothetical protein [Propionibacteriales bacterium]